MSVMIIYETLEGQTGKIARWLAEQVAEAGQETILVDTAEPGNPTFSGVDRVILAAPVHERRHPPRFEAFVGAQKERLAQVPSLMLSVSLKAAFDGGHIEARDYLREMKMRTGFTPQREILVAGAVRAGAYGYFETEVLRHVVLQGQDFTPEDGPHEFTDWDALADVVDIFLTL